MPEVEGTPRTAFLCDELRRVGVDIDSILRVSPTDRDLEGLHSAVMRILQSESEK